MQNRLQAVPMPSQEPKERIRNFTEVAQGYSEQDALAEASRCLTCPNPQCVKGCPVGVDIPAFIKFIKEQKYDQAISKIKEKNSLPAICGRVCPQELQCQKQCVLGKKGEPVSIGRLERFVADFELKNSRAAPKLLRQTQKGLLLLCWSRRVNCCSDLAKLGYKVVVYEALHVAGGVLFTASLNSGYPKRLSKTKSTTSKA